MADENPNGNSDAANKDASDKAEAEAKAKAEAEAEAKSKTVPYAALHEERERRKAADEELSKLKEADKARQEEEMKKKGEHEQLLVKKEEEVKTLSTQLADATKALDAFKANAEKRVAETVDAIKDADQKATLQDVLNKYDITERETVLPKLLKSMGIEGLKNVNGSVQNTNDSTRGNANGDTLAELEKQLAEARKGRDPGKVLTLEVKISQLKKSAK